MEAVWTHSPLPRTDLHTHSQFSKCSVGTTIEGIIMVAEVRGLEAIAITDHAQHVLEAGFEKYLEAVLNASNYANITVLMGLEVDIKPNGDPSISRRLLSKLDVVIGALHRLPYSSSSLDLYRRSVLNALRKGWMDILAHPTYVNGRNVRLPERTINEICYEAYVNSVAIELNSNHKSPSDEFIKACIEDGVRLTPVSDGHSLSCIGLYDWQLRALRTLNALGKVRWLKLKDLVR